MKNCLGSLLYRAPEGTYEDTFPTPPVHSYNKLGTFDEVFGFLSEWFDGLETFEAQRKEAIKSLEEDGQWFLNDESAGQWVKIVDFKRIREIHLIQS